MSLTRWIHAADPVQFWTAYTLIGAIAGFSLWYLFRSIYRSRLIADLPTSRVRSAAQGYVELVGTARMLAGAPIIAPLSGLPCVWYRYSVDKTARDSDNDGLFDAGEHGEYGVSDGIFCLDDGTARCVVDPEGADVHPRHEDCWRGRYRRPGGLPRTSPRLRHVADRGPFRYREARIHDGDRLYATGHFRTLGGDGLGDTDSRVAALMSSWKKDRLELIRRFDRDRDGSINLDEWEEARQAAEAAIAGESAPNPTVGDVYVLCKPSDGRPFLLSCRPFHTLTVDYFRRALLSGVVLLASALTLIGCLVLRLAA